MNYYRYLKDGNSYQQRSSCETQEGYKQVSLPRLGPKHCNQDSTACSNTKHGPSWVRCNCTICFLIAPRNHKSWIILNTLLFRQDTCESVYQSCRMPDLSSWWFQPQNTQSFKELKLQRLTCCAIGAPSSTTKSIRFTNMQSGSMMIITSSFGLRKRKHSTVWEGGKQMKRLLQKTHQLATDGRTQES